MRFLLGTSTGAAIGSFVQYKVKSNNLFARCDAAEIDRQNHHQNKASQAGTSAGSTPQSYLNYTPSSVWNENWDHCQHPANEENSTAVRQIILIRHGQYHHVRGGDHLHTLTDLGEYQYVSSFSLLFSLSFSTHCLSLSLSFSFSVFPSFSLSLPVPIMNECSLQGHMQAKETGKRLSLLLEAKKIFPIQRVYYSTMIRATETWQDIQSVLPPSVLPVEHQIRPCTMIREGAVCKPIPSATQWKVSEIDFIRDQPRVS
jgi:hypothetical protein